MSGRLSRHAPSASLVISILALVLSSTGLADAARHAVGHAISNVLAGHRISAKPRPGALLLLGKDGKFPPSALPTVNNASRVGGMTVHDLSACPPTTADLGTWCLEESPYPLTTQDAGQNNYFWASQACVERGGFLPSAAQLIGAAKRVKLESTIHDNQDTATVQLDPSVGLKDQREMSATLVTTAAGSDAAGFEGVSQGSLGNPRTGEPNPVPLPAVPQPATLQYVTVYSNGQKGGFAGSEPVAQPENFRCAYEKVPGANTAENG
ncbi:MAG TPA: hypothetical protein VID29_08165 [Solirubrobacteraceae bacterium]|jgi:hypothetical protein